MDAGVEIPGYGEALDPVKLPPYAVDLGGGIVHRVDADGTESWYKDGKFHRTGDLPAVAFLDGYQAWYEDGVLHRNGDKPALIYACGTQAWYRHGKLHRGGDKPALVYSDGTEYWYRHGALIGTTP